MTPPTKPPRPTQENLRVVETGDIPVVRDAPTPEEYKPVTREDVSDPALLPRHVRLIAYELQALTESVGRFEHRLRRIDERVTEMERFSTSAVKTLHDRIDEAFSTVNDKLDQIMSALAMGVTR